jgi:23S rRNA (guanine2445-N2)-methyltransferase / 23S rRNA (guanine2069-N7)-methyltransferase
VFDLVFCDPPTFSNSKMRRIFDVDRDQCRLVHAIMRHLSPSGSLIFSTNFRKFSLDQELMDEYSVNDITSSTIGDDFSRDPRIHQCFLITHKKAVVKLQKRDIQTHSVKKVIRKKD